MSGWTIFWLGVSAFFVVVTFIIASVPRDCWELVFQ